MQQLTNSLYFIRFLANSYCYVKTSILPKKNEIRCLPIAKGNRIDMNLRKPNEIRTCVRFGFYPPPHSSSEGGSLDRSSNRDKLSSLTLHTHSAKRKKILE